jgi:hypothetical protein
MNPRIELQAVLLAVGFLTALVVALAKKSERLRGPAFLLGWMLPGAGHVLLGRWGKGLFFFGVLAATYLLGLWIVGFRAVSWEDNPFYYVGQWGSGATFLAGRLLSIRKAFPREGFHPSWFDPGLLYVCVSGLLNIVVMLNVLELKRPGAVAPAPAPAPAAPPPPPAEAKA